MDHMARKDRDRIFDRRHMRLRVNPSPIISRNYRPSIMALKEYSAQSRTGHQHNHIGVVQTIVSQADSEMNPVLEPSRFSGVPVLQFQEAA
jgi:hypothetical protein